MKCSGCASSRIKKAGFYKNRNGAVQRYQCLDCDKSFSISNNHGMRVEKEKIHLVLNLLCESNGIRAISRLTKLHATTVLKILRISGYLSRQYAKEKIKNVKCEVVCADEIHTIVLKKDWNVKIKDPNQGNQYTFLAVDQKSKLIINSITGQRSLDSADKFFTQLKSRVDGRIQLNTDAWNAYTGPRGYKSSIKTVFGNNIDHLTEQKEFFKKGQFISKALARATRKARIGNPDILKGSTSTVERTNLTLRLFNRRFTRCTMGFSKKLINLKHSVELFSWHYNFARKHSTLKNSPAIAMGLASVILGVEDLWDYKLV